MRQEDFAGGPGQRHERSLQGFQLLGGRHHFAGAFCATVRSYAARARFWSVAITAIGANRMGEGDRSPPARDRARPW